VQQSSGVSNDGFTRWFMKKVTSVCDI